MRTFVRFIFYCPLLVIPKTLCAGGAEDTMQKILISSFLLVGFSNPAQAQDNTSDNALELPNMVVTATRTDIESKELSSATTVYTRKDIERLQVKTVPELLNGTSGVDMIQNGGYGQPTSTFIRGTNSTDLLVLIDGIRVGAVSSGTTAFEFIPIDQIEKIEIVKGPQSSLYGSEALGGVIHIYTRKGSETETAHVNLDTGGGSYDTAKGSGSINGKFGNNWYNLGASHINSQGFNATTPANMSYALSKDGYENTGINAHIGHYFDNKSEVEASFIRSEGINNYNGWNGAGNAGIKGQFVNQAVSGSGSIYLLDNWRSTLRLGQSIDNRDDIYTGYFNTSRWSTSWLNDIKLSSDHKLIVGADYHLDNLESDTSFTKHSRYDAGIFSELHSQLLKDYFMTATLRGDTNQTFGEFLTGNIGARYNWAHGISLLANFGNGFRAPTFNELYYPPIPAYGMINGNPNLKPEQSTSVETGVAGDHDWGTWELRAYHTEITDLITSNPPAYQSINIGKAQIDGLETITSTQILGWNAKLNLNLLNPINKVDNSRLIGRADKTLSFDLSRALGKFDVGTYVVAQGDRHYTAADTSGYVTVDLRSAYHINNNWMLNAKLSNVLDQQYQTVYAYNTMGRNFFLSIHYNN